MSSINLKQKLLPLHSHINTFIITETRKHVYISRVYIIFGKTKYRIGSNSERLAFAISGIVVEMMGWLTPEVANNYRVVQTNRYVISHVATSALTPVGLSTPTEHPQK